MPNNLWWQRGIIYQIYPRSFMDSNGDGVGDLPGIVDRLDYLCQTVGVDAIWLSPIYPSPGLDVGYDVADHTRVDPVFGTEADFDRLVAEAHRRGMRLILDLVMNHTSDRSAWFEASRQSRDNAYADCIRLSRIGWAALACGTGRAVLDYVIPYVNERQAFGEPISHRQAVAFMVANIGIELEGARLVTLRAASRAEQGMPFARESALARRLTSEYGMQIGSNGVQLLGGHGYVKEHPVERWYRDLRAAGVMEGVVLV